jgi:hypothetical protein
MFYELGLFCLLPLHFFVLKNKILTLLLAPVRAMPEVPSSGCIYMPGHRLFGQVASYEFAVFETLVSAEPSREVSVSNSLEGCFQLFSKTLEH